MTEYDAAAEMEAYEKLLPPRWKTVACPTCGMEAGVSCESLGQRYKTYVNPHAARKRAKNQKSTDRA